MTATPWFTGAPDVTATTAVGLPMSLPIPSRGVIRAARAAALGGSSVLLAATAHLAGGGMLPSAWVLIAAVVPVGLLAFALTARRCRFGLLLVVLAAEQAGLHFAFETTSAMPMTDSSQAAPSMWVFHAMATVLTAWLLARGERTLWQLAQRIIAVACSTPTPRSVSSSRRTVSGVGLRWTGLVGSPGRARAPPPMRP